MENTPISYGSNFIISPTEHGADVINTKTGRWFAYKSKHAAKWNITVFERLSSQLQ